MSAPAPDKNNGNPQSRFSARLAPSPGPPPTSSVTSLRPASGISAVSNEKLPEDQLDGSAVRKHKSHSLSSNPHTLASRTSSKGSAAAEAQERQRAVRTLPPWVQSVEDEEDFTDPSSLLLPRTPTSARPASHNYMPTPKPNAAPGRHFDDKREGTPVTVTSPFQEHASKWQQFTKATNLPRPSSSRGKVVDDEWMKEHLPDLEAPWHPIDDEGKEEEAGFWLLNPSKRKRRIKKIRRTVMNHPMVPLAVRLTVLAFSCLALGLAGSIFHRADTHGCEKNSSTWLALIIDVVAIVYTTCITWDEYTSKPLGLRSHTAKMRLIFFDLFFIVFDSANLSLAFQALTDERWACKDADDTDATRTTCPFNEQICTRQKALTATLLIALLAWLLTFAISTLRLIERVAR